MLPQRPGPAAHGAPAPAREPGAAMPAAAPTSVIRRLHGELVSRGRSVLDITEQYLQRIEAREPALQSFITVVAESAREEARRLDGSPEGQGRAGATASLWSPARHQGEIVLIGSYPCQLACGICKRHIILA